MYVRKAQKASPPGGQGGGMVASAFGEGYPALWEYLTLAAWDDGKPRQTATLTVFCEEGVVKLCLNDRDQDRSGWVSAATVETALERLDADLREDEVDWRRPKGRGGKGR